MCAGLITTLLPAIGAAAGYYFLKGNKMEGLLVGFIAGSAIYALATTQPFGLFASHPMRVNGAYAPLVVSGQQSSGSYIF